jgi:cyclic beta-1,2-glucan synthetase
VDECQIDSIAQSWAVLSGGAPQEQAQRALRSAESALIRDDQQIVRLLWPPFDLTARDPGYIKAYPPGVRENGGQYSHAAAWLGWALAQAGNGDGATRVFRMLNPIERARGPDSLRRYRLEPYVVAADIASVEPHVGRGGWSWYTGAAACCWRLGVEEILGLQRVGEGLRIQPRIPRHWPGFQATLRSREGVLEIDVENSRGSEAGAVEILVDGSRIEGNVVAFPSDGSIRRVRVRLIAPADPGSGLEA